MSQTQELAKWASELRWEDIPPQTRIKAKQCFLEFLSCCIVARNEEPARLLIEVLKQMQGAPQATVIGHRERFSIEHAALVNGALGHIWEIDDTHRQTMSHPGDSVIPAAMAVGESLGSDGPSVLLAVVAGYETAIRICDAVCPSHLERGWHPSGTTNTFGAAVAAGKLLGLDPSRMASALGLAATQAAGTFCHIPERAMSKDLNPGKAAANGLLAALLARAGFTGSPTAIENPKGFVHTHSDSYELSRLTEGLGESFKIDEIGFKPYSCCRHCHAAIDAILQLRSDYGLFARDIGQIKVDLYPMAFWLANDPRPFGKGFMGPRYSIQFNLALALTRGETGMERALLDNEFVEAMLRDPEIQALMSRVKVEVNNDLAREWPNKWPAQVEVTLTGGKSYRQLIEYPLGEPERPIAHLKLVEKFKGAAKGFLGDEKARQVIEVVENFEQMDRIGILMEMLGEKRLTVEER